MERRKWFYDRIRNWLSNFWVVYTILFVVMVLIVFYPFYHNGKTLIWYPDGWMQHYKALVYYGRWLRKIARTLLSSHVLEVPFYSFSLGYGGDILTTLHYYGVGDPLNLLSVFVPGRYTHYLYDFLIVLRLYLAGISFAHFCMYMKKEKSIAILAGTFVFIFCGFVIIQIRHPFFLNPFIHFPWLLLGVERIFKEKKPLVFIMGVFVSVISNFYFFYMLVILTVLYVGVRLITIYGVKLQAGGVVQAVCQLLSIGWNALIGVMLSAFLLLPVILAFLNSPRRTTDYTFDFMPSIGFLEQLPAAFLTHTRYGVSAAAILGIFLLFIKKKHADLKIMFSILFIFIIFPVFGYVLNGCAYVSERWIWGFIMLVSYILVTMWQDLFSISRREYGILLLLSGIYLTFCIVLRQSVNKNTFFSMALVFAGLNILVFFGQGKSERRVGECLLCGILLAGIIGNGYFEYSMFEGNYTEQCMDKDGIAEAQTGAIDKAVMAIGDFETFYRYCNGIDEITQRNSALLSGLSSVQSYWSLSDGNEFEFMTAMAMIEDTTFYYEKLDNRTIINSLSGIKYYFMSQGHDENPYEIPYGYEEMDPISPEINDVYDIYQNQVAMPLGYTYDSYITPATFDSLSPLERQEGILQGIRLETTPEMCREAELISTVRAVPYTVECDNDSVTFDGNEFIVTQDGASVTFTFEGIENAETYVYLEGLKFTAARAIDLYNDDLSIDPLERYTEDDWNRLSPMVKNREKANARYWLPAGEITIKMKLKNSDGSQKVAKRLHYYTPTHGNNTGRHDFLANLGYDELPKQSVTMSFSHIGTYHMDTIQVLCQPMDRYIEQISALRKDVLQEIDMHYNPEIGEVSATGLITGRITLDEPKILCLTIPYSTGWKAWVDGEPRPLMRGNIMFTALELEPGAHDIRLEYCTPGLLAGMAISAGGVLLLAAGSVIKALNKRKQKTKVLS